MSNRNAVWASLCNSNVAYVSTVDEYQICTNASTQDLSYSSSVCQSETGNTANASEVTMLVSENLIPYHAACDQPHYKMQLRTLPYSTLPYSLKNYNFAWVSALVDSSVNCISSAIRLPIHRPNVMVVNMGLTPLALGNTLASAT